MSNTTLRYVPLTIGEWTYHPEANRAARKLRWISGGRLYTTSDWHSRMLQDFGTFTWRQMMDLD